LTPVVTEALPAARPPASSRVRVPASQAHGPCAAYNAQAYMHTHTHAHTHTHTYAHTLHTLTNAYTHTHTHTHTRARARAHAQRHGQCDLQQQVRGAVCWSHRGIPGWLPLKPSADSSTSITASTRVQGGWDCGVILLPPLHRRPWAKGQPLPPRD